MAKRITGIEQLSGSHPTTISADCNVEIPGCYIDFDGNTRHGTEPGSRWTLRDTKTDARLRDLVVG